MRRNRSNILLMLLFFAWLNLDCGVCLAQEDHFSKENRDKTYEFFGPDGHIYDSTQVSSVQTIPSGFGKLVSVFPSPNNPKQREMWFEGNDFVLRRVILVPIKNRKAPYMIYREVVRIERD